MSSETWTDVEPPATSAPMVIAGRYTCTAPLGRGAMGEVWRATDRLGGAEVAVKLVPALAKHQQEQVRRELAALRWLRLPGVVQLLDDGRLDGRYFLVMQLVEGEPFLKWTGTWESVAPAVRELLENLARVHLAGVVHRDLKPANVRLDPNGHPVLLDFGVARGAAIGGAPGGVEGTPDTMAPEQIRAGACDGRTDLYALGTMLYRWLSGRLPHDGDLSLRLSTPAPRLATMSRGVPRAVCEVVDHLLERDPGDRPADALEVLQALGGHPPPVFAPLEHAADAEPLKALFQGPDGFLHLQTDAAALLWERTGGRRERVAAELDGWIRSGLAHWIGGRVAVDRAALERLRAGLRVGTAPDLGPLSPEAAELHRRLQVAWPDGPAADGPAWDTLGERGLAWRLPDGRAGVQPYLRGAGDVDEHRAIAAELPAGERRLRHLVAGRAPAAEIADEARRVAAELRNAGQLARAIAVAELGLAAAREEADVPREEGLLTELVLALVAHEYPDALDRASYAVERSEVRSALVVAMGLLVQAFRAAITGDPGRAEQLLAELGPFADPELEAWRQAARVRAAARRSVEQEEQVLAGLEGWAETGPTWWQAKVAVWLGNLRYRQHRFREAAALFAEGSAKHVSRTAQLGAQVNEAHSWLDALELDSAFVAAARARDTASGLRLAEHEGRAVLVERAAAYRAGQAGAPRMDLVEGARALGSFHAGVFALTEAAVAWRSGDRATGAWLSGQARDCFRRCGFPAHLLLADALTALCCGSSEVDITRIAMQAEDCSDPEIAMQVYGLLARASPQHCSVWLALARSLPSVRSGPDRLIPLDVLSAHESTEFIK